MDKDEVETMLVTLDLMGVALAEHDHVWTEEERGMYEKSIRIARKFLEVQAFCDSYRL